MKKMFITVQSNHPKPKVSEFTIKDYEESVFTFERLEPENITYYLISYLKHVYIRNIFDHSNEFVFANFFFYSILLSLAKCEEQLASS